MPAPEESGPILTDLVLQRLRRALMAGDLVPHQRLKVRELAMQMGTSETPVREALQRLAHEGAVEIRPRFFIRIARPDCAEVQQICDLRLTLEPLAATRALARMTLRDFAELEALQAVLLRAEAAGAGSAALQAHADFHFALYALAGNAPLMASIEAQWLRIGALRAQSRAGAGQASRQGEILSALIARDPTALSRRLEAEIAADQARMIHWLTAHPPAPEPVFERISP